jgi:hypothetical protein
MYKIKEMTTALLPHIPPKLQCLLKIILNNVIINDIVTGRTKQYSNEIRDKWDEIMKDDSWPSDLEKELKETHCLIILLVLEIFGFKKIDGTVSHQIRKYQTAEDWVNTSLGELLDEQDIDGPPASGSTPPDVKRAEYINKIGKNTNLMKFLNIIRKNCSPRFLNSEALWNAYTHANPEKFKNKYYITGGGGSDKITTMNNNKFIAHNLYNINNHLQLFKSMIQSGGANKNDLSTDELLYQKAELKYLTVKEVERGLKEVSMDCPLLLHANMFPEELKEYSNCVYHTLENVKAGKQICPALCDFKKCELKCDSTKLNNLYEISY